MRRAAALAVLLFAAAASAVPAPMSADEMVKQADLVIEAEVASVECVGEPTDKGDFIATEYRSALTVTRLVKGKASGPIVLSGYEIEWKKEQPTGGAPPLSTLPKGWRGKLHLANLAGGGHMPVWYNAVSEDPASSRPEPLPKCGKKRGCSGCALPADDADGALVGLALAFLWVVRRCRFR